MIEVRGLTKRFGDTLAVNNLSFTVPPGIVTGFLGPNGAGKSTTMRVILGLDRPTRGTALINGRPYRQASYPMREVGALLDAKDVHGGRNARSHLLALAQSNGIPARRVDEVLALVGLESVAKRRIKGFSLGMSQRLGIAATMLGDPQVLLFDEPVNGLDPEGIQWIRNFMKSLAAEGRTVFVSSHLMSEMALTADHLVVIGRGQLIADVSTAEFVAGGSTTHVRVRTPQEPQLVELLGSQGVSSEHVGNYLELRGVTCAQVGELAAANQITIHELFQEKASLEEAFMELTRDSVEYGGLGHADPGVVTETISEVTQ